jgi:hypothetical protein
VRRARDTHNQVFVHRMVLHTRGGQKGSGFKEL